MLMLMVNIKLHLAHVRMSECWAGEARWEIKNAFQRKLCRSIEIHIRLNFKLQWISLINVSICFFFFYIPLTLPHTLSLSLRCMHKNASTSNCEFDRLRDKIIRWTGSVSPTHTYKSSHHYYHLHHHQQLSPQNISMHSAACRTPEVIVSYLIAK